MYNFKKRLISLTSAAALAVTGFNVPSMQVTSYAEEAQKPIVPAKASGWTFGLYLCGQDLEEWNGSASADLLEILKADVPAGFSKNNNIIVETGGCMGWHFQEIYTDYLKEEKGLSRREIAQVIPFEIEEDKISQYKINFEHEYVTDEGEVKTIPALEFVKEVAKYDMDSSKDEASDGDEDIDQLHDGEDMSREADGEVKEDEVKGADMGNKYYLKAFLEDLDNNYPAEHMALDLWNHGGGIVGGVCYDEYSEDPITLGELKSVLSDRADEGFEKLDILGYDACLMSSYESWINLSAYAEVGVGSLTSEPGDGWYYTPFIEDLGANYADEKYTAKELASSIVDAYNDYYKYDGILMQEAYDEEEYTESEYAKKVLGRENDLEGDGKVDEEEGTEYDEDFIKEAEEYLSPAMLCAVDLEKLATSAVEFSAFADELYRAYADEKGLKTIFETATKEGGVEEGYEIVEISKLLDSVSKVAPERKAELKDSSNPYHAIAVEAYDNLLGNVDTLKEKIDASLINAYNGWEVNKFYDSLGMSLFVPDQYAGSKVAMFAAEEYPNYSIGETYAKLAYLYGSGLALEDIANKKFDTTYNYDLTTGTFSVSIPEEDMFSVDYLSAYNYQTVNNKTYLTNTAIVDTMWDELNVLNFTPDYGYYTLGDDKPLYATSSEDVYDGENGKWDNHYKYISGYLNDTYGSFEFTKDSKTGKYVFSYFEEAEEPDNVVDAEDKAKFRKNMIKKAIKRHNAKHNLKSTREDDIFTLLFGGFFGGVETLKPGDVIKLESAVASEEKYLTDDYEDVLKYDYSKEYVISKNDKVSFNNTEYDADGDAVVTDKKVYTPNLTFKDDKGITDNLLLGYDAWVGYNEETDKYICNVDYKTYNVEKIKAFADLKVSVKSKEYTLTGEEIKPELIFNGNKGSLVEGKDYEVSYENNIGIGTGKVVVKGLGQLAIIPEKVVEFTISKAKVNEATKEKTVYVTVVVKEPKKAVVKSVKNNKKKAFTVKWKKVKGATGYQVKYALNKKLTKGKKVKNVKDAKKLSLTVKKLKKNKTYFVKVRAYTVAKDGKKVYGKWSDVEKIKVAK
ncbi:Fibronectin type III domain-containing protein [Eubacterium uniforme]|uniref:Fibronectin type III domain-containing protein n=1 Tax=Eubacterium uniforme TaxID=39495 RepID=A0A1T4W4F4_9FIRM|nr:clostripain-related cysteine peptidase [Eubacterium uniforme]SKA72113.1 Fibronectin type III domain-containing protein [Eubacterium uniforme]